MGIFSLQIEHFGLTAREVQELLLCVKTVSKTVITTD